MKLLRTIRLDPSDTFVFTKAASAGEWAVPGSFMFMNSDIEALEPKERSAFRSGFLGVTSFGWSTLAIVTPIMADEREALVTALATALMRELGAPDIGTARAAAEEEIAFAASLCDHPEQTLIAVHRSIDDGELKERFRTLTPRAQVLGPVAAIGSFRAFDFFEAEDGETELTETVDLLSMLKHES